MLHKKNQMPSLLFSMRVGKPIYSIWKFDFLFTLGIPKFYQYLILPEILFQYFIWWHSSVQENFSTILLPIASQYSPTFYFWNSYFTDIGLLNLFYRSQLLSHNVQLFCSTFWEKSQFGHQCCYLPFLKKFLWNTLDTQRSITCLTNTMFHHPT